MRRDPLDGVLNTAMSSPRSAMTVLLMLGAFGLGYYLRGHPPAAAGVTQDNIAVHFSPKGGCTDAVVAEINSAKQTILVQAYSFTSRGIVAALIDAQRRGVKVSLVADRKESNEAGSKVGEAASAGIEVRTDGKHPIAHNKIMLIDGKTIVTGSFNFTGQAENGNAENLLVLRDKAELVAAYERNFREHWAHSEGWERR